ncbi:5009_t:CDS:1 [Funneliformis geosporum]|nr:5009_t:CDS:1 [Funneliformis geosporum]
MTKNNRNSRQQNNIQQRERSASPLQNNNNKKRNTTQTLEVPPEQSTSQTIISVVTIEVDSPSNNKGKASETLEDNQGTSFTTSLNIDESYDLSENFLDPNTLSVQAFDRPKSSFHTFFPLNDFPGTSSQNKISSIINLLFDKYDSFTGAVSTKHPVIPT